MKTKYLNLVSLIGSLLFLTACGSSSAESLSSPPEKACYELGCASIVEADKIIDPNGAYNYPDQKKFPDAKQRDQYRAPYAFLDLSLTDGDLKLSKSFRLSDFAIPQKGRYGLVSPALVKALENMNTRLGKGIRVTSGYRSPGYNADTPDSATWSRHTYGDAVDLQHSKKPLKQIKAACRANKSTFELLYPRHIHCDWRALPLDPAFYPPTGQQNPALQQNELALVKDSQIIYQKTNEGVHISTLLPLEDLKSEGVPLHEWKIFSPSGKVYEFIDSQILFSPEELGTHHVEVRVGDFFKLESRFTL